MSHAKDNILERTTRSHIDRCRSWLSTSGHVWPENDRCLALFFVTVVRALLILNMCRSNMKIRKTLSGAQLSMQVNGDNFLEHFSYYFSLHRLITSLITFLFPSNSPISLQLMTCLEKQTSHSGSSLFKYHVVCSHPFCIRCVKPSPCAHFEFRRITLFLCSPSRGGNGGYISYT